MEEQLTLRCCKTSTEYRVVKQISKGSYGDVFLAERLCGGHQVCLKQVDLDFLSPHERLGCLAEVQLLQSLPRHPNVVTCFDAFWEDTTDVGGGKRIVLALEYGDGGDLDTFIQAEYAAQRVIPHEVALSIFAQIAEGLAFLHARHILHRDIKSKNVFRFRDGRVVIGDFGTCKFLAHTSSLANTLVGSPLYMSPELLEDRPYSFSSDVWSLGCVLYELLMGQTPFVASSYPAVVFKITKGVHDPLPASLPNEIHALVSRMLYLDPGQRPTVQEILEDASVSRYVVERVAEHLLPVGTETASQLDECQDGVDASNVTSDEPLTTHEVQEDGHALLPPPAPIVGVKTISSPLTPTEPPPAPPPVKPTRASQQKARAGSVVFPTDRSRIADIVSKERLNVHKAPKQQQTQTHHFLSCVPMLDSATPAPQPALQAKKKLASSTKPTAASSAKPAAAVPPENMMIIGTKVHSIRSKTTILGKNKLK